MLVSSRRQFIAGSAAFASTAWAAPSKTVTLGFVGVGSHGTRHNLASFLKQKDCRALAVCDVFKSRSEKAAQMVNKAYGNTDCRRYGDFRELLAREDIDAVVVSTPDHWHVPISLAALAAGKHVFCEKPTLTIAEGRQLAEAVKQHNVIFQTGLEDRSIPQYHSLCRAVRNGAIGSLKHIDVELPVHKKNYVEDKQPPPEDLDWNMWLGPAPLADYSPQRVNWMGWRMIRDYSGGILTDWGAHLVDSALVANFAEKSGPVKVEGKGMIPEGVMNTAMQTFDLAYTFANGVTMRVRSGGVKLHFEGSDGWCGNQGWRGAAKAHDPAILSADFENDRIWQRPPSEHRDFLDAISHGKSPAYPAEDLHRLSSALHIGAIAMELDRKLTWDPAKEAFVGDVEADALRSRQAREWDKG